MGQRISDSKKLLVVKSIIVIFCLSLDVVLHAQALNVYGSNSSNINIPDAGNLVFSPINISGAPSSAVVSSVSVGFSTIHTYSSDLEIYLTNSSVTKDYDLWTREGGSTDNPTKTVDGIAVFNGLPVNGTWKLYVKDYASSDTGYIDSWWIRLYYTDGVAEAQNFNWDMFLPAITSKQCDKDHLDACNNVIKCDENGGYWHEERCKLNPPVPVPKDVVWFNNQMWTKYAHSPWTYDFNINTRCEDLSLGGYTDWRMPTMDELKGLIICTNRPPTGEPGIEGCRQGNNDNSYRRPTASKKFYFPPSFTSEQWYFYCSSEYGGPTEWGGYLTNSINFYDGRSFTIIGGIEPCFFRCVR